MRICANLCECELCFVVRSSEANVDTIYGETSVRRGGDGGGGGAGGGPGGGGAGGGGPGDGEEEEAEQVVAARFEKTVTNGRVTFTTEEAYTWLDAEEATVTVHFPIVDIDTGIEYVMNFQVVEGNGYEIRDGGYAPQGLTPGWERFVQAYGGNVDGRIVIFEKVLFHGQFPVFSIRLVPPGEN